MKREKVNGFKMQRKLRHTSLTNGKTGYIIGEKRLDDGDSLFMFLEFKDIKEIVERSEIDENNIICKDISLSIVDSRLILEK